jgi:colicin import membrane protein
MLIQSKIERNKGTKVTMGGVKYHFQPRVPNGPHIEDVEDDEHVAKFLSVSEAYKIYREEVAKERGVASDDEPPADPDAADDTDPDMPETEQARKTAADKAAEPNEPDTKSPTEPVNDPLDKATEAERAAADKAAEDKAAAEKAAADKAERARYNAAVKASGLSKEQADLVSAVLSMPDSADDEAIKAAFVATHDREPNGQAKRETVLKFIRTKAAEMGLVEAE